jgi:hypothetical protein
VRGTVDPTPWGHGVVRAASPQTPGVEIDPAIVAIEDRADVSPAAMAPRPFVVTNR